MTRPHTITLAAGAAASLLLMVLGAAGRPLVIPETPSPTPVLNETEIGFAQDMTAHHQQALIMVQRLPTDIDPTVRLLAQQVADAQRLEIGLMLGWLRLANVSPTAPSPVSWMHVTQSGHHRTPTNPGAAMPGMATPSELDALATAHGRDAETLFLQLMQRHHYGGIAMAQAAEEQLTHGPVKQIARDMIAAQGQEAGFIGLLLTQRRVPAHGLPAG